LSVTDTQTLPKALDAERVTFDGRAGPLSYYVAGSGAPLLLAHSINAAGSAFEVKPIFERYRGTRRVYAPDLPGFGFSDRSDRDYSVRLYTDAVHDMADRIAAETKASPIDALALSLSSEFLARAASENPDRFRSLAFVTPTGFRGNSDALREPEGTTREMAWLYNVLTVPLWRRGLYGLLVKPTVIRYFLKRTWGSDDYDEGLAAYDDLTTHQPGAEHAPYAFLSGRLFSKDIRDVYERLRMPVWLPHGTRGDFKDFSGADWARQRSNWLVQPFDGGALPHFEHPVTFFSAFDRFLAGLDTGAGAAA
jgi:pimeloyl-ACP methyl ester carboxylesterase